MRTFLKVLGVFTALCLGLWAYIHFQYPDYSHRFRLIVEVETPDGVKAGSSVMESTRIDNGYLPLPGRSLDLKFKGEAVFVDLGQGRNLIAVLAFGRHNEDVDGIIRLALKAFGLPDTGAGWAAVSSVTGRKRLPFNLVPNLISFEDLNDPRSVRGVRSFDLERTFGPGFSLGGVSIEMTNDPVTRTIKGKMPWLAGFIGTFGGRMERDPQRPERYLSAGHLLRG